MTLPRANYRPGTRTRMARTTSQLQQSHIHAQPGLWDTLQAVFHLESGLSCWCLTCDGKGACGAHGPQFKPLLFDLTLCDPVQVTCLLSLGVFFIRKMDNIFRTTHSCRKRTDQLGQRPQPRDRHVLSTYFLKNIFCLISERKEEG